MQSPCMWNIQRHTCRTVTLTVPSESNRIVRPRRSPDIHKHMCHASQWKRITHRFNRTQPCTIYTHEPYRWFGNVPDGVKTTTMDNPSPVHNHSSDNDPLHPATARSWRRRIIYILLLSGVTVVGVATWKWWRLTLLKIHQLSATYVKREKRFIRFMEKLTDQQNIPLDELPPLSTMHTVENRFRAPDATTFDPPSQAEIQLLEAYLGEPVGFTIRREAFSAIMEGKLLTGFIRPAGMHLLMRGIEQQYQLFGAAAGKARKERKDSDASILRHAANNLAAHIDSLSRMLRSKLDQPDVHLYARTAVEMFPLSMLGRDAEPQCRMLLASIDLDYALGHSAPSEPSDMKWHRRFFHVSPAVEHFYLLGTQLKVELLIRCGEMAERSEKWAEAREFYDSAFTLLHTSTLETLWYDRSITHLLMRSAYSSLQLEDQLSALQSGQAGMDFICRRRDSLITSNQPKRSRMLNLPLTREEENQLEQRIDETIKPAMEDVERIRRAALSWKHGTIIDKS